MQRGKRRSWRPLVSQNEPATFILPVFFSFEVGNSCPCPCASEVIVPPNHCEPSPANHFPVTDNFQGPYLKTSSFIARTFHSKSWQVPNVEPALSPPSPKCEMKLSQSSLPLFRFRAYSNTGYRAGYSFSPKYFSSAPYWIPAIFSP